MNLAITIKTRGTAVAIVARQRDEGVHYVEAGAQALPFADGSFDYCSAITSLCFVPQPLVALQEMWRVARRGVVLGLLNRHSLLYWQKRYSPGYAGARWDSWREVRRWSKALVPAPVRSRHATTVFVPSGTRWACRVEQLLSSRLPWGGFLAVALFKEALNNSSLNSQSRKR
jgi:SAM-dependent methyltransferase